MTQAMEILLMHGTDIPAMISIMEIESELWHCPLPFNGDVEYHFKDGSRFERRGNQFFICGKELNMATVLEVAHMVKECQDDIDEIVELYMDVPEFIDIPYPGDGRFSR